MPDEPVTIQECERFRAAIEKRIAAIEWDIKLAKFALLIVRWSIGIAIATGIIILVERVLK